MTKITMWTHPTPKITSVKWMAVADPKAPFMSDFISYIASQVPYLMNSGMSGYNFVSTGMPNPYPFPGLPAEIAGFMGTSLIQNADDPNVADKIFKPLNDTLKERWQDEAIMFQITEQYPSFIAWFDKNYDQGYAGQSSYIVSRLLDGKALSGDPEALGKALKAGSAPSGGMSFFMVAGKGVQDAKPRGGNAVNPAWRTAYVHARKSLHQFRCSISRPRGLEANLYQSRRWGSRRSTRRRNRRPSSSSTRPSSRCEPFRPSREPTSTRSEPWCFSTTLTLILYSTGTSVRKGLATHILGCELRALVED